MIQDKYFSKENLDLVEEVYARERKSAKPVTAGWVKKAHHSA